MRAVSKLQAECADGLESVRIYTDLIERTACRMRGSSAKSVRQSQNPSQVKANTAATYQWGLLPLRKICVYKLGQVELGLDPVANFSSMIHLTTLISVTIAQDAEISEL